MLIRRLIDVDGECRIDPAMVDRWPATLPGAGALTEARTRTPVVVAMHPATGPVPDARDMLHAGLMTQAGGLANGDLFARMLASQAPGMGALPPGLGLERADFAALMARHFPRRALPGGDGASAQAGRQAEREDLLALLAEHRAGKDDSECWMAEIVAAACMGGDHL